MREIKFRRAHFIDKAKTKFHHVDEWGVKVSMGRHTPEFTTPSSNNVALFFTDYQFTGLSDKTGTEIYEGDIAKDSGGDIWLIRWCDDDCCLVFQNPWDKTNYNTLTWLSDSEIIELINGRINDVEVIGNVYANPELLNP